MNANSDRLRPSSTRRALASLGVHPWRVAIRLSRLPLSAGRRMLITTERVVPIKSPLQSIVTLVTIVAHLALGQMRGYLSEGGCQACGTQNQTAVTTASDEETSANSGFWSSFLVSFNSRIRPFSKASVNSWLNRSLRR